MDSQEPEITAFYDQPTGTVSYLIGDPAGPAALVVDPVLDYDGKSGRTATRSVEAIASAASGRRIEWIVETHPHADHMSGAQALRDRVGGRIAIGAGIVAVQKVWSPIVDCEPGFACDGSQFDRLLREGDSFEVGSLRVAVIETPGHTPACIALVVEGKGGRKHVFVGDVLFMPDSGTARTDFPGGSARTLYRSIRRILVLPSDTRLFTAHDYQPGGRALAYEASVADQRARNIHVHDGIDEDSYVAMREARDARLEAPNLLLPSIQVNIRAGHLPPASPNGTRYLKIPLDRL